MGRRRLLAAVLLATALVGGVATASQQKNLGAASFSRGMRLVAQTASAAGKHAFILRPHSYGTIQGSVISNLRVNGQNPATFELGSDVTIAFSFDAGESIAFLHLFLDFDGSGTVTPADVEIGDNVALVDNSDLDADPTVGSFRATGPSFELFPAVAKYVLALEGQSGWATCPIEVTAPPTNYSFSGTVTTPANVPGIVVGARFGGDGEDEGLFLVTLTDASGRFYIPVPEALAGDSAMVIAVDFLNVTGEYVFSMPIFAPVTGHLTDLNLDMMPANAWVRVHVADQLGNPIAGIDVGLEAETPSIDMRTDESGVALLRALTPGTQPARVHVWAEKVYPNYSASREREIQLVPGDTVEVTLRAYANDATIEGYVYMDGQPKPGVRIWASNDSTHSYGWSDIGGHFVIPVCSQAGPGFWLGVDLDRLPGGYMVVGPHDWVRAGSRDVRIDLIRATAEIHGYVTNAQTGQPIAHAWVWAQGLSYGNGDDTDESGYYSIPIMPGSYEVSCNADNYLPASAHVEVSEGSLRLDFSLTPFVPARISGRVYDSRTVQPIGGVRIVADGAGAPGTYGHGEATSGPDGSYEIVGLPPGDYLVMAYGDLWARVYYPGATDPRTAVRVHLESGSSQENINFFLSPAGAIRGRVTDAVTGQPISQCLVTATETRTWMFFQTTSASNGTYVLGGLPPGAYIVQARAMDGAYLEQRYRFHYIWEGQDTVVVRESQYTDDINFAMIRGCVVGGQVRSRDPFLPLPNAEVVLESRDGTRMYSTLTDSAGNYLLLITDIPTGEYIIRASAPGYVTQWYPASATREGAGTLFLQNGLAQLGINFDLDRSVGVAESAESAVPSEFALRAAFPNPFNPSVSLRYDIPVRCDVVLEVLDATGRHVRQLEHRTVVPGRYMARWDGTDDRGQPVSSGVYLFILKAGDRRLSTKATLLR